MELYRATGEVDFLTQARTFQGRTASHFFVLGYANTGDLSAFELTRLGVDGFQTNWLTDVNLTISRVVASTTASELIKGAFIRSDWGNAGNAAAAAFSAALAFQITGDNTFRDFAVSQMKWVAFIRDYLNPPPGLVRILQGVKAVPEIVDLNIQTVDISFTLETAASWKLVLEGKASKARKTFAGSGTAGSAAWSGAADEGVFMAGETVEIQLQNDNIAPYHMARTRGSFFISALKKEAFRSDDALIDDFEDGDAANALGGPWTIFNDKEAGGTSYANPAAFGPTLFAAGEAGTKGISVRLVGAVGATQPRVGIRSAFNAAGATVGVGPVKSVVFDVKSTAGSSLWVEMEQPSISDGAYYAYPVSIGTDQCSRVRVPLASFVQPAWRKTAVPFNSGSVTALRFAYNGVGTIRFDLDNVRMEAMKVGPAPVRAGILHGRGGMVKDIRIQSNRLEYAFTPPAGGSGIWVAEIADASGKVLAERGLACLEGILHVSFPGTRLAKAWYTLRHRSSQGVFTEGFSVP